MASDPALHVLYAVGSSSTERALAGSPLGAFQVNAPLLAEAMGQLPDGLMFSSYQDGDAPALIRELGRGELQTIDHALHVQHAVRHMPVVGEHGLFVQKVVRSAQLESAVRNAVLDAHHSSTPGHETLLDPFGLGSPRPGEVGSQTARSELDEQVHARQPGGEAHQAQKIVMESAQGPVDISVDVESADDSRHAEPIQPVLAQGFRSQLQRMATDRGVATRPLTRIANPS